MAHRSQPMASTSSSVIVRPYKDSDETAVLELFVGSQREGVEGAPINSALRSQANSRPALFTYGSTIIGVGLLWTRYTDSLPLFSLTSWNTPLVRRLQEVGIPILATLVPLASVFHFFLYRRALRGVFNGYVTMSLEMDMKDIGEYYMGFDRSAAKGQHELSEEEAAGRENLFWVAEDVTSGEVIGCVGLDSKLNRGPGSIELRRMAVALSHRKRGIGHLLTRTLVDHVKRLNQRPGDDQNKIKTIKLATTSFQKPAMHMYEQHGWTKADIMLYTQKHRLLGDWVSASYTLKIQNMILDLGSA